MKKEEEVLLKERIFGGSVGGFSVPLFAIFAGRIGGNILDISRA